MTKKALFGGPRSLCCMNLPACRTPQIPLGTYEDSGRAYMRSGGLHDQSVYGKERLRKNHTFLQRPLQRQEPDVLSDLVSLPLQLRIDLLHTRLYFFFSKRSLKRLEHESKREREPTPFFKPIE